MKITLKNPAPQGGTRAHGEDARFGDALVNALMQKGADATQDFWPNWSQDNPEGAGGDAILVLRGPRTFLPPRDKFSILWIISHPASVTKEELDSYNLVLAASAFHQHLLSGITKTPVELARQCTDTRMFHPWNQSLAEEIEARKGILYVADRQGQLRDMAQWIDETDIKVRVFGSGWKDYGLADLVEQEYLPHADLPSLYRSARLGLNDHVPEMRAFGLISNRIFDAMACGLPVVTDSFPELRELFGDALLYASSAEELKNNIELCNSNYAEALGQVREKWRELADSNTFDARATEILEWIKSPPTAKHRNTMDFGANSVRHIYEVIKKSIEHEEQKTAYLEKIIVGRGAELARAQRELKGRLDEREARIRDLKRMLKRREREANEIKTSTSWRITSPLRAGVLALKRLKQKNRMWMPDFINARRSQRYTSGGRSGSMYQSLGVPPTVSVIVTTYNSMETIETSLDSLLSQTCNDIEIIVVDDASTDATFQVLDGYSDARPNIRVFKNLKNMGTYWCKNFGLTQARGDYVTFQDSDDTSANDRIERQLQALRDDPSLMAATCNYVRVDGEGKLLNNRGEIERRALMAPMFHREAFLEELGYYDSVRTSADAELIHRLVRFIGKERIRHIDKPLYYALVRENSLTQDPENTVDLGQEVSDDDPLAFLSPARREYAEAYDKFHAEKADEGVTPRYPFPLLRRPFAVPEQLYCDPCSGKSQYVTASVASMPSRVESLEGVVSSILPQVDELCVYLNNYRYVPEFLDNEKIRVARSQDHGDLRDNGKFFFAEDIKDGFHLVIDDDILYPSDYVRRMILRLIQYDYRVVVGLHGIRLAVPMKNFIADREVRCFWKEASSDELMNLLGTGTVAYHTSTLDIKFSEFKTAGMADLWLAVIAKNQGVPMISIKREPGWLDQSPGIEEGGLYHEAMESDDVHTRIAKENGPWGFNELADNYADFIEWLQPFSEREIENFGLDLESLPIKVEA